MYSSRYIVLKEEEIVVRIDTQHTKKLSLAREDVSSSEKISSVCD